jgi:hypothetical protein
VSPIMSMIQKCGTWARFKKGTPRHLASRGDIYCLELNSKSSFLRDIAIFSSGYKINSKKQ